jgi:hypothetical protein
MSRSRSISTDISTDERLGPVGEENPLAVLLYTLAIPHADDWGRLKGDATAFRYEVAPFLLKTGKEIDAALDALAEAGLWRRYEVDGRKYIAFPRETWFKHQSYINIEKRTFDGSKHPAPDGESWEPWENSPSAKKRQKPQDSRPQELETPRNAKKRQESPQNPASPSPSPSPSPSGEGESVTTAQGEPSAETPLPPPPESPSDSEGRLPAADPAARRLYEAFRAERFPKAIPTDWSRAELSRDLPYLRIWVREGLTCEKVRLLVAEARRRQFPSITVKAISENITDLLEDALAPSGRATPDSPGGPAYRVVTPAMMAAAHSRPDDGPDPETFVPGWVK